MAEPIDEFFSDDRLTESNLRDSAAYIHAYLKGEANVHETLQKLRAAVGDANTAVSLSEILDECIVRLAEQLPGTHDALVELVMLWRSQQQQTSEEHLSKIEYSLVMSLGERWARYGDPDPQDAWKEEARAEWARLNRFTALLFAVGIQKLASFGEQTLKFALRKGSWRVNWKGPDNTSDSVIALEGHAPAAAHWIIVCGKQLHDECTDAKAEWATLRTNMAWIVERDDLNKDIKSELQEAKAVMDSISA